MTTVEPEPGGTHHFTTGDSEWTVLPLGGGCTVRIADEEFQLLGRESVFAGVTDFAYVPRDAQVKIASGAGGRFALAGAKCERRLPARYGPAPEVPVERRGDGTSPRPTPEQARAGESPPSDDEQRADEEAELEKIHCFGIDGPNGFGHQCVFPSREGGADALTEVRSGDAVPVPDDRHGPAREWRICFHPEHTEGYR